MVETGDDLILRCLSPGCSQLLEERPQWSGMFSTEQSIENSPSELRVNSVNESNSGEYRLEGTKQTGQLYSETVDVFVGGRYSRGFIV